MNRILNVSSAMILKLYLIDNERLNTYLAKRKQLSKIKPSLSNEKLTTLIFNHREQ